MQKKLIALAVAGLVSAPAFAQSNVTIYGLIDMTVAHTTDSMSGASSRTGLDSSSNSPMSGSRIGFRGVEDLGNGLKASFVIEGGVATDTGTSAQGGRTWGRQSFVALSGGFGTVAAGRQYSPQFSMLGKIDPFGLGSYGDIAYSGVYKITAAGRIDNLLAYVSPSMSGFQVVAGYSGNAAGNETGQDGDLRVYAINPTYTNGPIFVGLNYHVVDPKGASEDNTVWDLGGTYDFGMVKLAAVYGQDKIDDVSDLRRWMVGATVPVGQAGAVKLSYQSAEQKEMSGDNESNKWAIGYEHKLSKRTNLHATYGAMSDNDLGYSIEGDYETGFAVGLRHTF